MKKVIGLVVVALATLLFSVPALASSTWNIFSNYPTDIKVKQRWTDRSFYTNTGSTEDVSIEFELISGGEFLASKSQKAWYIRPSQQNKPRAIAIDIGSETVSMASGDYFNVVFLGRAVAEGTVTYEWRILEGSTVVMTEQVSFNVLPK